MSSAMPNQTEHLTPDELKWLRQYCAHTAQADPATLITQPPLIVDPMRYAIPSHDISGPSTSSLCLSPTSTHSSLPLSTQVPLGRPAARGTCIPSSTDALPQVPGTLPTERLVQRRTLKRQYNLLESGTEDSGTENANGSAAAVAPIDRVGLLLDDLMKAHEAIAKPQLKFIMSETSGGRVEDLTHLFAERDAFILQLLGVVNIMATQMKELQASNGEGDIQVTSQIHTRIKSRKRVKVEHTPLEQRLYDLIKARTRNIIQHVLDFKPSDRENVLSMGDVRKTEGGTESKEPLDIPDWSQGPRARANEAWMVMINKKTCADIEGNNQELCKVLNDGQRKEFVLEAITRNATAYFDHLRRRWKDENDVDRLKRREAWSKQVKRDQRVRLVHKRLIKEATLEQVNIWIEKAAICLSLPKVEITEDDIPQDALSDLESDAEDVSYQDKVRYAKEAGLVGVTSKWMSRRKTWTSEEFEALKDLVKFVMNSCEARRKATTFKRAPTTPQYRGPLTLRKPLTMKNIQDWMVDPMFLDDDIPTCKKNRTPPFTSENLQTLKKLLDTALEIGLKGDTSEDMDDTELETQ